MRGMKVLKFLFTVIVYGSRGDIADLSSNYYMAYYILHATVKMFIMLCSAYYCTGLGSLNLRLGQVL